MAPKEKNDGPKQRVKKVMSPEQLEILAKARAKASEVRQAMKEGREEAQVAVLQNKIDKIKAKKQVNKIKEEPEPNESANEERPECVPKTDESNECKDNECKDNECKDNECKDNECKDNECKDKDKDKDNEECKEDKCQAGPPVEKLAKKKSKTKKPIVIMHDSGSDSSSEDDNVIYIKNRKKKKDTPPPAPELPKYTINRPLNPFFGFSMGIPQRNFQ